MMTVLNALYTIRLNHQAKWKLDIESSNSAPKLIRCLAHNSILSNTSEALLRCPPNLVNLGEVYCREPIVGTSPSMNNDFLHPTNLVHARESFPPSTLRSLSSVSSRKYADRSIAVCASEVPLQDHMRSEYEPNDACLHQLMEKHQDLMNRNGESDER
jgi:hypothetical protein